MYSNPLFPFMRVIPGFSGEVYLIKISSGDTDSSTSFYVLRYQSDEFSELLIHHVSSIDPSNIALFPLSEGRFCVWSKGDPSLLLVKCTETDIKVIEIELNIIPTSLFVHDGLNRKSRIECPI